MRKSYDTLSWTTYIYFWKILKKMKTLNAFFYFNFLIILFILCKKMKKSRKKICIFEKNKYNTCIIG